MTIIDEIPSIDVQLKFGDGNSLEHIVSARDVEVLFSLETNEMLVLQFPDGLIEVVVYVRHKFYDDYELSLDYVSILHQDKDTPTAVKKQNYLLLNALSRLGGSIAASLLEAAIQRRVFGVEAE